MWRINFAVLCSLFLVQGAFRGSVSFHDCESTYDLQDVEIDNCDTSTCRLQIGSTVNVTFHFVATENSGHDITSEVIIYQMGISVPQESSPNNMCEAATCPLAGGLVTNFTASFIVSRDHIPTNDCSLEWRIFDQSEKILCMQVAVQLTRPLNDNLDADTLEIN